MTSLSDLLLVDAIHPRARWTSRKQAIAELVAAVAEAAGVDARLAHEAVLERERLGSTAVGEGVAIPHARLAGVVHPVCGFARLVDAVDFDAIDERPCDLIFLLLAPLDAGADHLRALARVSRAVRQEAVRARLRRAQSVEAVLAALAADETSDAA